MVHADGQVSTLIEAAERAVGRVVSQCSCAGARLHLRSDVEALRSRVCMSVQVTHRAAGLSTFGGPIAAAMQPPCRSQQGRWSGGLLCWLAPGLQRHVPCSTCRRARAPGLQTAHRARALHVCLRKGASFYLYLPVHRCEQGARHVLCHCIRIAPSGNAARRFTQFLQATKVLLLCSLSFRSGLACKT